MFAEVKSFTCSCWQWIKIFFQTFPRDIVGISKLLSGLVYLKFLQFSKKSVCEVFDNVCEKHPDKICFQNDLEQWTFQEVQNYSNQVGNYFLTCGYKKGDTVALYMESCPKYVGTWLGLSKIGVVTYLINTNLRHEQLKRAIDISKCKAIIYSNEFSPIFAELYEKYYLFPNQMGLFLLNSKKNANHSLTTAIIEGQTTQCTNLTMELLNVSKSRPQLGKSSKPTFTDHLFSIYTSGTTGFPKAAIVRHSRFLFASIGYEYVGDLKSTDIIYTCLPLYHSMAGIGAVSQAIIYGKTVVLCPKFSAKHFWKDCIKHKVTVIQTIGELCRYLLNQPVTPEETQHTIRIVFDSGIKPEIWKTFLEKFNIPKIVEIYGSTEGNCGLFNSDGKVGAVGFIPIWLKSIAPVALFKVNPESGEILRNPETGVAIRCQVNEYGEMMGKLSNRSPLWEFGGYANDKMGTEKQIVKDVFYKGSKAFRSGDYLLMDEFGYIYFKDRAGDSFRWKGENVSTAEIESVLSSICNLKDCIVYGVEIPGTNGKAGMATLVDQEKLMDLNKFASALSKVLPSYARPMFLRITDHLEITATYKLQKVKLRNEGFNILEIEDPIYFYLNEKYVSLDEALYQKIVNGKVKL